MSSRRRFASLLSTAVALWLAVAGRHAPVEAAPLPSTIGDGPAASVYRALATCTQEPGGSLGTSFSVWSPDRWYSHYTRLSACAACTGPLDLKSVTFRARWASVACPGTSVDIELSVVGAIAGPGCPVPDTSNVICGPVLHTINSPGAPAIHTLPLPAGCCAGPGSFVRLRYVRVTGGDCVAITNTPAAPPLCAQFFQTLSFYPGITESSGILISGQWFSIDADCCEPTPAVPESWGRLKSLYR